ncbi:MAG: hypothetical protein E8D50_01720 [Nitrospira sp.]|nr:MAG: hypothetical protein E8D50_01720 [Nitrospira sp.]
MKGEKDRPDPLESGTVLAQGDGMMRLLPTILWVTLLLGCSGENARVKAGQPQMTDQVGNVAIDFAPPSPETIPGSQMGEQIRLGYEIVVNTQEYAKPYVGNRLNCTNCHLDGGLNPNAASFVGLAAVYPEYRSRNDRVNTLADRVNECMQRSLNGKVFPPDSSKLQAVVAYITWLSSGVPSGAKIPWRGLQLIRDGDLSILLPTSSGRCRHGRENRAPAIIGERHGLFRDEHALCSASRFSVASNQQSAVN